MDTTSNLSPFSTSMLTGLFYAPRTHQNSREMQANF